MSEFTWSNYFYVPGISPAIADFTRYVNKELESEYGTLVAYVFVHTALYLVSLLVLMTVAAASIFDPKGAHKWIYDKYLRHIAAQKVAVINHAFVTAVGGWVGWFAIGMPYWHYWNPITADFMWLVDFSLAYFIVDTALDAYSGYDKIFLFHHVAAFIVWGDLRFSLRAGTPLMCIILMIAEVTNLLQAPWRLAKSLGYPGIVRALSAPLTYSFMFFRCVCYPIFYTPFVCEVFFNPPSFPGRMQEVYFVTFSITGVLIGGFEWSRSLYIGYKRMLHKENKSAKTH
eukprot:m.201544 g.201544  ORF g.201544 m.201544 type:complete len:286 (+) comp53830_c0_seq4:232-1089(+)